MADSTSLEFVAEDSAQACLLDEAQVSSIDAPSSAADSAANQITANFCSDGSADAVIARHVIDLPAGGHGKLKAIALDPSDPDSATVIESNEVTYNGGIDGEYSPSVLRVSSEHQSLLLKVTAVGAGLDAADAMRVQAADASWSLPLTIASQSNASVTGIASVAALLPDCEAVVGSVFSGSATAQLAADEEPESESPLSCSVQYNEALLFPAPGTLGFTIQPKDFAFAKGFVDQTSDRFALHLFYIRHNYWYDVFPPQHDLNEKNIGHIWTTDFNSWFGPSGLNKPDTVALAVRTGKFDELHVWAPTIVQNGPVFHMFYTGVRQEDVGQHQRIGVATSTDLITWTPEDDVLLTAPQVPWAKKDLTGPVFGGDQQLRDPFVMEDPVDPSQWLMYFVAADSLAFPKIAVGVARSSDLRSWTALDHAFSGTLDNVGTASVTRTESPHVFRRNGQWWMPYTIDGTTVVLETSASADPADTTASSWTSPVVLRDVTEGEPVPMIYWHATEYLRINSKEYLAAFNDNSISIEIKSVLPPADAAVDSVLLGCPEIADAGGRTAPEPGVRLSVMGLGSGATAVTLRIGLPERMPVRLALHDIAGRRIALLVERELPSGTTEQAWNGVGDSGARVPNGVYFARLSCARGDRVSKLILLR